MMKFTRLVEASLQTDQGLIRDHNEDFVSSREPISREDEQNNGWLYIVADGVGGADAGEVASQFASERTLEHYLNSNQISDLGERLRESMQAANTDLRQLVADRNDHRRMATTMVAAVIREQHAYIANVGDSRGYHFSQGEMHQVTKDQSLVAKLVEEGAITEAEAAVHPRKNVILYSLGSEREPQIDLFERSLMPGDILLLCSDGLTRHVSDAELSTVIAHQEPAIATQTLLQLAISRGGEDNISVAVLKYKKLKEKTSEKRAKADKTPRKVYGRTMLWIFTFLLSLVQSFLIFLVWLFLRV